MLSNTKSRRFVRLFKPLVDRGIPFFWEEKGPLLSQKEYWECMVQCRLENNKFGDIQKSLSGKIVFYKLASEFELLYDFKATCAEFPKTSYPEMMELKAHAFDMVMATLPGPNLWRAIQQYRSTKFKTHP